MKNLEKTLKKTILTGALAAAAIAPMKGKAAEKTEGAPKTTKIEMQMPAVPEWIITDKDGNFDKQAVADAFDKLNYKEKIPQVWEIYKDARKNGYSEKHTDQMLKLFPQDKSVEVAVKDLVDSVRKDVILRNTLGGAYVGLALTGFVLSATLFAMAGKEDDEEDKKSTRKGGAVGMLACLTVAATMGLLASDFGNIIKSEKEMKERVMKVSEEAYNAYMKETKKQMVELAPEIVRAKFAEQKVK